MKGLALSNSDVIRSVHNSYARSDPFVNDGFLPPQKEEDAFHFVAYVPVDGVLYELDGVKQNPVNLGECVDDTWLAVAARAIQHRMQLQVSYICHIF